MKKPNLTEEQSQLVQTILRNHIPKNSEVWVFGSRATPSCKPFSDLDLFLKSAESIDKKIGVECAFAFEESAFPYKVDLVDWEKISPSFREVINNNAHFLWFTT